MNEISNNNTNINNRFTSNLDWRCAIKEFDIDKKLNASDSQLIIDSIRMSPSSYGLQPFRVIVVRDQELKNKLKSASFNQSQIDTCSDLFIFVAKTDVQKRISEYCDIEEFKTLGLMKRAGFEAMVRGALLIKNKEETLRWATNQTYIALGFGLAACAELHIDSCAMEGFNAKSYGEILGLGEAEQACVLLATGYRKEDSKYPKVRFSQEQMFEIR